MNDGAEEGNIVFISVKWRVECDTFFPLLNEHCTNFKLEITC